MTELNDLERLSGATGDGDKQAKDRFHHLQGTQINKLLGVRNSLDSWLVIRFNGFEQVSRVA